MSIDAPAIEPAPVDNVQSTVLASLRAKREGLGANTPPEFFDVPGYDGELVLQFKWVPLKELSRTSDQLAKIKDRAALNEAAAADAIAATCSELYVRVEGQVVPLSTNDVPVTFSEAQRVAGALGFPVAPDTRTTVVRAFNNEYALIKLATAVTEWLEDVSVSINDRYLGE